MKNKLSSLLRKIFLGSLAGIAASNTNAANNNTITFNPNEDENKVESLLKKTIDLTPKLLLKKNSSNEWFAMAHRSHRSHSSHRSHYSSSSGGTYTPPSNSGNSGLSPGSGSSNSGTTTTALRLGSRTLKKGMSGTDVTELINLLLKKQYLTLDGGGTQVTGTYTFDAIVEGAVKKFQKDNGLTADGECGSTTIYYLKNK
jgi:murein L,D-transpeptidase YcbB/YkuD